MSRDTVKRSTLFIYGTWRAKALEGLASIVDAACFISARFAEFIGFTAFTKGRDSLTAPVVDIIIKLTV